MICPDWSVLISIYVSRSPTRSRRYLKMGPESWIWLSPYLASRVRSKYNYLFRPYLCQDQDQNMYFCHFGPTCTRKDAMEGRRFPRSSNNTPGDQFLILVIAEPTDFSPCKCSIYNAALNRTHHFLIHSCNTSDHISGKCSIH